MNISRRAGIFAASTAILALSLTACGSSAESSATPSASAGFSPVTIKNIYGSTEITEVPETIATISWVNADTLLALDTVPAGMDTDTYGQNANNSTDWKDAALAELGAPMPSSPTASTSPASPS